MMSVPASVLPIAEVCPEAAWLAKGGAPGELWRRALRLGIQSSITPALGSLENYRAHLSKLSDVLAVHVQGAVDDAVESKRSGQIPTSARFAQDVTSKPYGAIEGHMDQGAPIARSAPDFLVELYGSIDHAWTEIREDGPSIAVVLQHELIREGSPHPDDLDVAALGLMWTGMVDCARMRLGRCYHAPAKPPIFRWSPVLDELAMGVVWERCKRAVGHGRSPFVGPHCESCRVRRSCTEWQHPVLMNGEQVLRPFTNAVTAESYPRLRRLTASMREVLNVAEARMRTFEKEGRA